MKNYKRIVMLLFVQLPMVLAAQTTFRFELTGSVPGSMKNRYVQLVYVLQDKVVKDSMLISEGRFTFSGSLPAPAKAYLSFPGERAPDGSPNYISLYLEQGVVAVTVTDYIAHAVVKGGSENKVYLQLLNETAPYTNRRRELLRASYSTKQERDSLVALNEAGRKQVLKQFIPKHPNNQVSLDALMEYAGPTIQYATVAPLFHTLSPALQHSVPGTFYAARLEKAKQLRIGSIAPDFTQTDTAGIPIKLSSFRGKYVLLDFWASWCKPCRAENPNVVKAYQQYKNRNFTVIGVSLDKESDRAKWIEAIHQDGLCWTQVSDLRFWKNEVGLAYGIQAIPQNFLIDPEGKIIAVNVKGAALQAALAAIIPTTSKTPDPEMPQPIR